MTIKEVSELLGVSKPTISKTISELGIQPHKVGNRYVLTPEQIELIKSQKSQNSQSKELQKTQKSQNSQSEELQKMQKSQNSQSEELQKTQKSQNSQSEELQKMQKSQNSQSEELQKTQKSQNSQNSQSETEKSLLLVLETLQEQLKVKDEQIANLNRALISSQEQQKILTEALSAAQALHAGTLQERLTVQTETPVEQIFQTQEQEQLQPKKSFFKKLFGKD